MNLASYFLDSNLEAGREGRVAVLDEQGSLTYGEVHAASCRAANALRRRYGVELEDRVLLALPDSREFVFAWFGAARAGAVIAMVNVILPADDYAYYAEYTRAKVAVIESSLVPIFERLRARGAAYPRHVVVARGPSGPFASFDAVLGDEAPSAETAPTHRDDPGSWLCTSGSSGRAKAAVHLQHDLPWNTERYAKRVLGLGPDDRTVSVPKLFFGYATGTNLLFPFAVGGSTALFADRSTPARLYEMNERYRPTVLTSVPTMFHAMLEEERAAAGAATDLSGLRFCLSAGEALPPELYHRWKARFGVEILDGIGSAEMFHIYITNKPGDVTPGSLGTLVPGYEARIVDDATGRDVAPGDVGTLLVRGDSAMVGYWQEHEKSKRTCRGDDWVATSDQFRRDEAGRFWYAGRADDLLKVSGIFVSPSEVENCLLAHPAVLECAVAGFRDEGDLVKPLAFVVPRDRPHPDPLPGGEGGGPAGDALARELMAFVKARLAPYKYPRKIVFLDALPKNERGKLDRKVLRARPECGGT